MEKTVAPILLHVEKSSRTRLLDAALDLLGSGGANTLTVRAAEDAAGLPHGSVRHHFGDRAGLVRALFDHLAEREGAAVPAGDNGGDPAAAIAAAIGHRLGPGRTLTLARYELFLLAARDPALRPPLVAARDRFVALAAARVGAEAAPAVVAAIDGLVLDALVRGERDPARLAAAAARLMGGAPPDRGTRRTRV
jgi:AcrR family transcriptional regulator